MIAAGAQQRYHPAGQVAHIGARARVGNRRLDKLGRQARQLGLLARVDIDCRQQAAPAAVSGTSTAQPAPAGRAGRAGLRPASTMPVGGCCPACDELPPADN